MTASGGQGVVRSSALVEDRADSSFAGQFESFLELQDEEEFLVAVRAAGRRCGRRVRCATWRPTTSIPPTPPWRLIVQPLVAARVSGGGLSRTAEGDMVINAAPGLGSAIAQGEVAPDRYVLDRGGALKESALGRANTTASPASTEGRRCRARSRARAASTPSRSRSSGC